MSDPVNPKHYNRWKIEPWDFIYANDLPFWLGNVIKYGMRYDSKDGLQDLKKARAYLDKKIKEMETTHEPEPISGARANNLNLPKGVQHSVSGSQVGWGIRGSSGEDRKGAA